MLPKLPEIFVPTTDKRRLAAAANDAGNNKLSIARFLRAELRRAHFCDLAALPAQTVVMNGELIYRIDWGAESTPCRLVYPEDFVGNDNEISLLSPLGVALLGLHAGDRMPFFTPEHAFRLVTVVRANPAKAVTASSAGMLG